MASTFKSSLSHLFLGNVYAPGKETLADGGEACLGQMSVSYRVAVYISIVIQIQSVIHVFLYKFLTNSHVNRLKIGDKSPILIEKVLGVAQVSVFFLQIVYKSLTSRLIFFLSHCHLCALMQGYLLLSSPSKLNSKIFVSVMIWSSGAFSALLYPEPGLITYAGELELFWAEHILGGLVCPFVLVYGKRHCLTGKVDLLSALFGFHSFSLFGRLIQGTASVLTWANINFQLCFPDTQFPYTFLGNHYLYILEAVFFAFAFFYIKFVCLLARLLEIVSGEKKKKQ